MNRKLYLSKISLAFMLLFFSCRDSELKRMPDTLPDIRGSISSITNVAQNQEGITISVTAAEETATGVTEASINVTDETLIEDSTGKKLSTDALRQGQEVDVWFGETTMESHPIQTDAIAIRVTSQE